MPGMSAPGDGHDEAAEGEQTDNADNSHPWRELHEWGTLNTKQQRSEHQMAMALERLVDVEEILDAADLDIILEMIDEFKKENLSDQRFAIARVAMHIDRYRLIANGKPGCLSTAVTGKTEAAEEAVLDIKRWLTEERDLADNTIGDYLQTIKHLGEYLFEEMPERFDELNPRA